MIVHGHTTTYFRNSSRLFRQANGHPVTTRVPKNDIPEPTALPTALWKVRESPVTRALRSWRSLRTGDNHHGPAPGALYDRGTAEFDIGTVHRRIYHARGYDHCGYSRLEREGNLTIYLPQQTRHLSRKPA